MVEARMMRPRVLAGALTLESEAPAAVWGVL